MIFDSGGLGVFFTNNSLLAQYSPDLLHPPTINGMHCTGDAIKMGEDFGARTIDLERVQVIGLVKPNDVKSPLCQRCRFPRQWRARRLR